MCIRDSLTSRTITIVGLSVALGIGMIQAPGALALFPDWARTIFGESAVVISSITAIFLNIILPEEEIQEDRNHVNEMEADVV